MGDYLTREEKDKWKHDVIMNRVEQCEELTKWLLEKNIEFKKDFRGIDVGNIFIDNTMRIKFFGSRKLYQYNLEKAKERILQIFPDKITNH